MLSRHINNGLTADILSQRSHCVTLINLSRKILTEYKKRFRYIYTHQTIFKI